MVQAAQVFTLLTLVIPVGLCALQLFGGSELAFLPFAQLLEPGVLKLKLLELGLLGLELGLRGIELLIQLHTCFGRQGHHAGGLILQLLVRILTITVLR